MIGYFNGNFLPHDEIRISPEDRGFLFADSLYEVIRSYRGVLFRPEAHIHRLNHGARQLRFPTTDFSPLIEVASELLRRNDLLEEDAQVYFQVTRGAAPRDHGFPKMETPMTVYGRATPFASRVEQHRTGINVILVHDLRWARCDIKTTALTANVLANQQACDRNAQEALFVRDGVVLEGTHTNFVAVLEGTVVTHPQTNVILPGVTIEVVLELCDHLGIPNAQRPIREEEVAEAEELLVVGTSTEITPVVQVDGRPVGDSTPGPVTRRLQAAFDAYVRSGAAGGR